MAAHRLENTSPPNLEKILSPLISRVTDLECCVNHSINPIASADCSQLWRCCYNSSNAEQRIFIPALRHAHPQHRQLAQFEQLNPRRLLSGWHQRPLFPPDFRRIHPCWMSPKPYSAMDTSPPIHRGNWRCDPKIRVSPPRTHTLLLL